MKKVFWIVAVVIVLTLVGGAVGYIFIGPSASQGEAGGVFRTVTPLEAKSLIETRKDLLLVDVRSPEEFEGGSLPGATLIPFWDFAKGRYDLPKDKPILLICAVGGRSLACGQLLASKGYREVYNLKGGLDAWAEQRVPLPRR
ncbi:MAG: rhodanese-like domain-containing protein [Candidatus Methylomirabilia bacterium]